MVTRFHCGVTVCSKERESVCLPQFSLVSIQNKNKDAVMPLFCQKWSFYNIFFAGGVKESKGSKKKWLKPDAIESEKPRVHLAPAVPGLSASSALRSPPPAACLNLLSHSTRLMNTHAFRRCKREKASAQSRILQQLWLGSGDTGWRVWVRREHWEPWLMTWVLAQDRKRVASGICAGVKRNREDFRLINTLFVIDMHLYWPVYESQIV